MGGGGGGPSSSTTYTSNLPEYARPYYERLMDRTEAESNREYAPYTGQRVAGFGEDSQDALNLVRGNIGAASSDLSSARDAIGTAATAGKSLQDFQPSTFNANYQGVTYRPTGFDSGYQASGYNAGKFDTNYRTASFTPSTFNAGYQTASYSPNNFSSQNVRGSFAPSTISSTYTGPADYQERVFNSDQVQAGRAQTGAFDTAAADRYMSPYLETVLERQKDAALRDFRIGQAGRDTQAIRAGAFGGSRAAIQQAMAEEDLSRRIGDIDATGRQQAFSQAMAQFNQDQARDLQAQGMSLDQAIRAQLANQAANMQAQQLTEQSNQFGFGAGETGRQRAAELGLTAQQASDASRRFGSELDIRGQLANQAANLQTQQMGEQSRQFGAQLADASNRFAADSALRQQQLADQSRQFGAQFADASNRFAADAAFRSQQAGEQSRQFGAQFADASNRFAAENALREQQLAEQANQFGSNLADSSNRFGAELSLRQQGMDEAARQEAARLGLAGGQLSLAAGQGLGGLGSLTQQIGANDANALMRAGMMQDAMDQRGLDVAYDDFVNQRDFDRNQLLFYGSMLRGMPVNPQQEVRQFANPNPLSQMAGLGIAGLGAYRMMG